MTMTLSRIGGFLFLILVSLHSSAEVLPYDGKKPLNHGILVGVECNQKNLSLVLSMSAVNAPRPSSGTEFWNAEDLVRFNGKTFMLEEVFKVERQCKLGSESYLVQLEGVPGANNAMQLCGAGTGVHAKVWLNDKLQFDEDLHRCSPPVTISRVVFGWGA
jgi:hypothetical protein